MVIGANGYVGRHLDRYWVQQKAEVVRFSSSLPGGIDPNTGLLPKDFIVPQDTDVVYFLAQSPYFRDMPAKADHLLTVNVIAGVQAARAAVRAGVKKFVYTSTGNVYASSFAPLNESSPLRRDNWYSLSKVHAEEALMLMQGDISITIARLFGVYGPEQKNRLVPNIVESIARGESIRIEGRAGVPSDESGMRLSLCYITDLVYLLAELGRRDLPPIVNLASTEVLSIRSIALATGKLLGQSPKFLQSKDARKFDLIADTGLLLSKLDYRFTPFSEGLAHLMDQRR